MTNFLFPLYPDLSLQDFTKEEKEFSSIFASEDQSTLETIIKNQQQNIHRTKEDKKSLSAFIRHSQLVAKIEKEFQNPNPFQKQVQSLPEIISSCSEILVLEKKKKNEILFKINDVGDKCYFIVSGQLSILKPIQLNEFITYDYYIRYLVMLHREEEQFLLSKVVKENFKILPIDNNDELQMLFKSYFVFNLRHKINDSEKTMELKELEDYFSIYHEKFENFGLDMKRLENKYKLLPKGKKYHFQLREYLLKKIAPSQSQISFFINYQFLLDETVNRKFILYKYELFLNLPPGSFFGDVALDSNERRRNATIRAEEDSVVGSLPSDVYHQLIYPNNKKAKVKELAFLCNDFFFTNVSPIIFEKYYFHFFKAGELSQKSQIYQAGTKKKEVFFLQSGRVKTEYIGSVIDMHNLIRYLIGKLEEIPGFKCNSKKINYLNKHYLNDKEILRMKSETLMKEMNKKEKYDLFLLCECEVLGIEEYCLDCDFITTCEVKTDKAKLLKIDYDNLTKLIKDEKSTSLCYFSFVYNRILSLIKRLNQIKRNKIDMTVYKMKNKLLFRSNSEIMQLFIRRDGVTHESNPSTRREKEELKYSPVNIREEYIDKSKTIINSPRKGEKTARSDRTNRSSSSIKKQMEPPKQSQNPKASSSLTLPQIKPSGSSTQTVVRLNKGYFTVDIIENEINLNKNKYLIFEKGRNSLNLNSNKSTKESIINFMEVTRKNEKICLFKPSSKGKKVLVNPKIILKTRSKSQEDIMKKVERTLEKSREINTGVKLMSKKVKEFYQNKKKNGYCSIINLENNCFAKRLISRKNSQKGSCKNSICN